MDNHSCLIFKPRETDYIKDQNSPIVFKANLPEADWSDHIDFFERQKLAFETEGCVLFTAQEAFDAQINNQIENGQVPYAVTDWFTKNGYMDPNSTDGQPRFHTSPRFLHVLVGSKFNGTAMPDVWDIMRKYGCAPWTDLPFDETTTVDQYFAPISQDILTKAAEFLAMIGGKNSIQYHWIVQNGSTNVQKMAAALPQAPLCLGTPVCQPWNQVQPPTCSGQPSAHSTMCYKVDSLVRIFDHYIPFLKQFAPDYPIPYVLQGIVSVNYTPTPRPPAPLPVNPTTPQISNWLDQLTSFLYRILATLNLKGRNLSASAPMNYSLLRSKTFWTLLVMFLVNGWASISGNFSGAWVPIVDFALTSVASYFHLQTGNSTAGSN